MTPRFRSLPPAQSARVMRSAARIAADARIANDDVLAACRRAVVVAKRGTR
jgi:hypothetical protein